VVQCKVPPQDEKPQKKRVLTERFPHLTKKEFMEVKE
jgi:hypothetical protein